MSQSEAYRRSYAYSGPDADVHGARMAKRPGVREYVAQLEAMREREALLDMTDRRTAISKIVRHSGDSGTPTHGDRLRAIELDARLSGELRSDGIQIVATGVVTVNAVLDQIRGARTVDDAIDMETSDNEGITGHGSTYQQGNPRTIEQGGVPPEALAKGGPPPGVGVGPQDQDESGVGGEPPGTKPPKTGNVKKGKSVRTQKSGDSRKSGKSQKSGRGRKPPALSLSKGYVPSEAEPEDVRVYGPLGRIG